MANGSAQHTPGPSNARRLRGSQPGILDPTQPSRLLRLRDAKLSFAAFDPLTACCQGSPTPLNAESYRPRRVVIETAPTGECTWRFVPSAKRESGVTDEGSWPRVVDLCGEFVEMTQDQWDIYKLDPLYECFVPISSHTTTIRAVPFQPRPSSQPTRDTRKRQLSSCSPPPQRTMPPPASERRTFIENDGDDEYEVEAMFVSGEKRLARFRAAVKRGRERIEKQRQERREKIKEKMMFFSQEDEEYEIYSNTFPNASTFNPRIQPLPQDHPVPEPIQGKRKANSVFDTPWSTDSREVEELRIRLAKNDIFASKKARQSSPPAPPPSAARKGREFQQRKMKRDRDKQQRRMEEAEARRRERDRILLDEIMMEIPSAVPEHNPINEASPDTLRSDAFMTEDSLPSQTQTEETQESGLSDKEDQAHRQTIQESRQKLAELERDRPLWEEQAKQRQLHEEIERQAYQTQKEQLRQEEVKKKAEIEDQVRKEHEEAEIKKREQERRQRRQRWSHGPWTTQRALECYHVLSESFDATKFTPELPLSVEDVPWPSLQSPRYFSVEDVSWDSVERFFEAIRPHLRHQDFKTLVEQSHRRFHPDRWRSRNLLKTVQDETIRDCMEVAVNTVTQALTPIWKSLKDR